MCMSCAGLCCTVFVPETKRIDLDEAALHSKSMFGHFMDRCGIHQVLFRIKYHIICPRTCASVHHSLVSGLLVSVPQSVRADARLVFCFAAAHVSSAW